MGEQSHRSDYRVLNRRRLERDHPRLAEILEPGMVVLDVGCGTGAITAGIAKKVGAAGRVVGVDRDDALLASARQEHEGIENLSFERADALSLNFDACFDIVTAARTLQWVSEPGLAIGQMTRAVKTGGRMVVLDYNHAENAWMPEPPPAFMRFYAAFLDWRTANQWSNRMADLLPVLFQLAGVTDVRVHFGDETVERSDPDFSETVAIWGDVIARIGPRLVAASYLTEGEVVVAGEQYSDYAQHELKRQTLAIRTVEGRIAGTL